MTGGYFESFVFESAGSLEKRKLRQVGAPNLITAFALLVGNSRGVRGRLCCLGRNSCGAANFASLGWAWGAPATQAKPQDPWCHSPHFQFRIATEKKFPSERSVGPRSQSRRLPTKFIPADPNIFRTRPEAII